MNPKNLSKDVLDAVKKKTGHSVSEKEVQRLAGGVNPKTVQSEAQLRQLIKQVSKMANVPVSAQTMNEIVHAVKGSGMKAGNLEQIMKMMLGKK